jgi:hypothetical protein
MKHTVRILIGLCLVLSVLLPLTIASAKPTRIDFTGSEWCDPNTFVFTREWWDGDNYHARGISQTCYDTATIPQMTGMDYLYDSRLDAFDNFAQMKMSGKLNFVSDEGGEWVATWKLPLDSETITVIGHGKGKYKGLELHWFLKLDGSFQGYILDRGNDH